MEILMNVAMKTERSGFLGAGPYERVETRRGYANGFKGKTVQTRMGELELAIPQVRGLAEGEKGFYPQSLERGLRSERALKLAIAEMYVKGISTRKVAAVVEKLCGLDVSSSQVSAAAELLDEELKAWRNREIGEITYLLLDARYEKVRHAGAIVSCGVLVAVGIQADGKRSVLGVSVALSEAEVHWRAFLKSLQERGLHGVRMITTDDHKGLLAALEARFPGVPWQRCQVHLQRNAAAYVPKVEMRKKVARDIRSIINSRDKAEADERLGTVVQEYVKRAPKLAAWLEENIPESLTVFKMPEAHRRRIRTTNMVERLNREIKRRTRVATLFPNESSLLRLASAVLSEVSEEWESGKIYLSMKHT